MSKQTEDLHSECQCCLDPPSTEVDAGGSFTASATISCERGCDLAGLIYVVRDGAGHEVARAPCTLLDQRGYGLKGVTLQAPVTPGSYAYPVSPLVEGNGRCGSLPSAVMTVLVRPHITMLNVWDVPSTVVAGEDFSFHVGLKCSSSCPLAGRVVRILDADGQELSQTTLGADIWPGTDALHFQRMNLRAPTTAGLHKWTAVCSSSDEGLPHAAGRTEFQIEVRDAPEHELRVEVRALASEQPLQNATIVMHPFRAVTGPDGVAHLRVAKGDYTLLVSCSKHLPSSIAWRVAGDEVVQMVLAPDMPWTPVEEA